MYKTVSIPLIMGCNTCNTFFAILDTFLYLH
uniref:Uncharacterized protein n=1 Tax=Siphoviridae sp. ct6bb17 TaxID=2825345 RepID=A0A8S5P0B0_9CAUD|nr:MAG TPA: hypothetical protein [Siphoviridae sp. ct6bb17]